MKSAHKTVRWVVAIALVCSAMWARADILRVAFIDPLSGTFAALGENELKSFQEAARVANEKGWAGAHKLEFVGFDNKANPQESLVQLQRAIDQGFRYITQGNSSGAALALIDAINKHNARNRGQEVVFLNHGAVEPRLTNELCSFWHFRFDANADMKSRALSSYIASQPSVKKVYLLNQDYAAGHGFARAVKEYLKAQSRPDLQIVGEELHPFGQVRDFSPYVAKIKGSGADSLVTGNWGSDLTLLVRAIKDSSLDVKIFTYYADLKGTPTALGAAGEGRVKNIGIWNVNSDGGADFAVEFKKRYKDDFTWVQSYTIVSMLSKAIRQTGSIDAVKVAFALEGMKDTSFNGDVEMRALDHQLQQSMVIKSWEKKDGKAVKYDAEDTGFGFKTEKHLDASVGSLPTSCQMTRPPKP